MTQRSKSQYASLYGTSGTLFPDNTTGDISEADMRQFGEDQKDSLLFISDNFSSTPPDSSVGSATVVPSMSIVGAYRKSGVISSAQILNGFSSPPVLVPAPGAGLVILPISFFLKLDYNSVAYATNTDFRLEMGLTIVSGSLNIQTMLPATQDYWAHLSPVSNVLNSSIENTAIELQVLTGNPTAGNSPIYYTAIYAIVPTS